MNVMLNGHDRRVEQVLTTDNEVIRAECDGVTEIIYHTPMCDGDRHYVDVCLGKRVYRLFDFDEITWVDDDDSKDIED